MWLTDEGPPTFPVRDGPQSLYCWYFSAVLCLRSTNYRTKILLVLEKFSFLISLQMHLVFYSTDYESFDAAQNRPQGLSVIAVLFEVSWYNIESLTMNIRFVCTFIHNSFHKPKSCGIIRIRSIEKERSLKETETENKSISRPWRLEIEVSLMHTIEDGDRTPFIADVSNGFHLHMSYWLCFIGRRWRQRRVGPHNWPTFRYPRTR